MGLGYSTAKAEGKIEPLVDPLNQTIKLDVSLNVILYRIARSFYKRNDALSVFQCFDR